MAQVSNHKDPSTLLIFYSMIDVFINDALIDLGFGVNIIPFDVFQNINIELKPTDMRIQLANYYFSLLLGIIEDFIMNADKFYFHADFVILNIQDSYASILVILGRPYLAISDAIINYKNGLMPISSESMNLELNIFI